MAADGHLGMMALSRVTLASAGLSCVLRTIVSQYATGENSSELTVLRVYATTSTHLSNGRQLTVIHVTSQLRERQMINRDVAVDEARHL